MRKMASIQLVADVAPIQKADAIEAVRINGWWVVAKKGEFVVGQKVVFLEVDAWVPHALAPFLSKGSTPRTYEDVEGERLKTVRLRGQLSQGLVLPLSVMGDEYYRDRSSQGLSNCWVKDNTGATDEVGADVTQYLGVLKYEVAVLKHADAEGVYPSFIPKTDQERVQNCFHRLQAHTLWSVEEKIEGQSHTVFYHDGVVGVCSRNYRLREGENTFWNTAKKYDLVNKLTSLGRNLAVQSEQCGPGISGNIYKFDSYKLFVFDIYDIDQQCYLTTEERDELAKALGLEVVPWLWHSVLPDTSPDTLSVLLASADGESKLAGTLREGLIYRLDGTERKTFKAVSNQYLLQKH